MPSVSNILTSPGRFGRVLRAGDPLYFTFAVQNDASWGVQVNFRAFSINIAQSHFDYPDFTLDMLDNTGGSIGGTVVLQKQFVPRYVPQTGYGATSNSLVCANGVYGNANEWGMRDSMPVVEVMRPTPIAMRWQPQSLAPVHVGGSNVYTGALTCTSDIYLYAFFSRLF